MNPTPDAAAAKDRRSWRCLIGRHPGHVEVRYVPDTDSWLPGIVCTFCAACGKRVSWEFESNG